MKRDDRSPAQGVGFAASAVLLALAAMVLRGGAGFAEARWIAAAAWLLGVMGVLAGRFAAGKPGGMRLAGLGLAVLLMVWGLVQLAPWPERWSGAIWGGERTVLDLVAADARVVAVALDRFASLHALILWTGLGALGWAACRSLSTRLAYRALAVGIAGIGVGQTIAGIFLLEPQGWRLCGTFGSPDAFGGLLAMSLPVTLGLIFRKAQRTRLRGQSGWRWWLNRLATDVSAWGVPSLWAAFFIQMVGLLFSGSLGASVAAAVACVGLAAWQGHAGSRRLWPVVLFASLLLLAAFSMQGLRRNVVERTLGDTESARNTMAARVEIWRAAVRLRGMFPLGVGAGGTALALPMAQEGTMGRYRLDYVHNDSLQFLGDFGAPGFALLAAWLGLTAWVGWKGCGRRGNGSGEEWVRRGVFAAFAAALVHAQVEFNLSGRPGIQVVFALLCGALWAPVLGGEGEGAAPAGWRRAWRGALGVALALMAIGAAAYSIRVALGWRLQEAARRSLGFAANVPQWFSPGPVDPEQALSVLGRAVRLVPGAAAPLEAEAMARRALFRRRIDAAARQLLPAGDPDEEAPGELDAVNPVHRRALAMAELALRIEEAEMLGAAQRAADEAVARAPWDASSRLVRARVRLRRATVLPNTAEAEEGGRRDLELVVRLHPAESAVLAEASAILAEMGRPEDRDVVADWGGRALAINPRRSETVLWAWSVAGVPMDRILAIPDLPATALWQLYGLLERGRRDAEAQHCLDAIGRMLEKWEAPAESALWGPSAWRRWEMDGARQRLRWVRESLRHALRRGDWATARALGAVRDRALWDNALFDLDADLRGAGTDAMRRLRLRDAVEQGRVPPKWVVEWAIMEVAAGMSAKPVLEPIGDLVLMDELDESDLLRLMALRATAGETPFLAAIVEAKRMEQEGNADGALHCLMPWLAGMRSVPRRFVHRLWLWEARLQVAAGDGDAAARAWALAVEECPSDPDLLELSPRDVVPSAPLDLRYFGGRLRLGAIQLLEDAVDGRAIVRVQWRFLGRLPGDLQVELRLRDGDGRILHRARADVDRVPNAAFNRGAPALGAGWAWDVPVPPRAAGIQVAQVLVRSGVRPVPTDEGLPLVELRWEVVPRGASAAAGR